MSCSSPNSPRVATSDRSKTRSSRWSSRPRATGGAGADASRPGSSRSSSSATWTTSLLRAIVTPAGCRQLRAVNPRGTGNVEHDHRGITLDGPHGPVRVRIAALAGYLLSKAAAARTRGADKDYYDLAYVLLHNRAGGPAAAAAAVNASKLQPALAGMSTTFLELRERFRNDRAHGPQAFARESLKVAPGLR